MWLLLALVSIPLIEIALFIVVGGWIGVWATLGLVLVMAIAGMAVVRHQGAGAALRLREAMERVADPSEPMAESAMILLAGLLLLLPGFFTDVIGLLLLIPPLRRGIWRYVRRNVRVQTFAESGHSREPHRPGIIIDGEFEEIDPSQRPTHGNSGWTRH